MAEKKPNTPTLLDALVPFIFGGISGCTATTAIQPIDTVKVRIQIQGEALGKGANTNPISVGKEIIQSQGIKGLYKGLDSALFRQITYGTARLGIFKTLTENTKAKYNRDLYGYEKVGYSLFAGFTGSLIGNPADLCLVRFQADGSLPVEQRRNYKNVIDALVRIIKEEGVLTLWRGGGSGVARAMAMNLGMLAPFEEAKDRLNAWTGTKDTLQTRLIASAIAGFSAAFFSLPFDNIKTKVQKMKPDADGKMPYSGFFDCAKKSIAKGGLSGLWIGFFPTYYIRVAPHAMIALLTQDWLHLMYKSYKARY